MWLDLLPTVCDGFARGAVYQFAEGPAASAAGGLVLSEVAFDFIHPVLIRAWPEWPPLARYGESVLPQDSCGKLIAMLHDQAKLTRNSPIMPEYAGYSDVTIEEVTREFEANTLRREELADLYARLANWLEGAVARRVNIHLLGI